MGRYLCISVTFLDPYFHGSDDAGPEWPPSPLRLFQALFAGSRIGHYGRSWTDATEQAFRWLEKLRPPTIITPETVSLPGYTFFVPNNDSDKPGKQDRSTKIAHPHRLLDGDTIHYLWPLDGRSPEDDRHAGVICRQARNLMALGWGIDQVFGNGKVINDEEAKAFPGARFRPLEPPLVGTWRVPVSGTLDDLNKVFLSSRNRFQDGGFLPPLKPQRFGEVTYLSGKLLPPRRHAVFELPEGIAFRQKYTVMVAGMLRSLTIRQAQSDGREFPGGIEAYV
ncbi:MAG: type I-U CRISPR-associated protein Csb2, partial [Dehalococcoidia bacterium]|nr:type I-U CRISPR-associated protein Csb2 [Dehalococcoidia bacterium]